MVNIHAMSTSSQILRNTMTQVLGKSLGLAATVGTIALMTRALGPAGFGAYATAFAFLQVAFIVVDLGLQMTSVTLVADPRHNPAQMLGNVLGLRIATALGMAVVASAGVWISGYPVAVKLAVAMLAVNFVAADVIAVLTSLFQYRLRMGGVAVAEIVGKLAQLGFVAWAVAAGGTLLPIVGATTMASLVHAGLLWGLARRLLHFRLAAEWPVWREILRRTWPLALTIAFNLVYFKMDTVILSAYRSPEEVGLYGAPYRILELCINLGYLFLGLLLPLLTQAAAANNRDRLRHLLQRGYDAIAAAALPLVVGGAILAEPLMVLVAGPAFAGSGPLLSILLVATAVILLAAVPGYGIVALGNQRRLIPVYAANAAVALAAYWWLIPRFGAPAAAWLTVGSELVILGAAFVVAYRVCGFFPKFSVTTKAAAAATVMAVVVWFVPGAPVVARVAIGGAVYLVALKLLGGLPLGRLREIWGRSV